MSFSNLGKRVRQLLHDIGATAVIADLSRSLLRDEARTSIQAFVLALGSELLQQLSTLI